MKASRTTVLLATAVFLLGALALTTAVKGPPAVRLAEGLRVECKNGSIWPATGDDTERWPLRVAGHEVPEIEVVSDVPLARISLRFEERASSSIEIEGGLLEERILLPDGGLVFALAPRAEGARHRFWPLPARYRYPLRWVMPKAPAGPLGLTLEAEPES